METRDDQKDDRVSFLEGVMNVVARQYDPQAIVLIDHEHRTSREADLKQLDSLHRQDFIAHYLTIRLYALSEIPPEVQRFFVHIAEHYSKEAGLRLQFLAEGYPVTKVEAGTWSERAAEASAELAASHAEETHAAVHSGTDEAKGSLPARENDLQLKEASLGSKTEILSSPWQPMTAAAINATLSLGLFLLGLLALRFCKIRRINTSGTHPQPAPESF